MIAPFAAVVLLSMGVPTVAHAQAAAAAPPADLPTVTLSRPVTANGEPLAPGTYAIRITMERPRLPSGAASDTQRWVEFLAGGKVVAREVAEILTVDEFSPDGSPQAASPRPPLVQLLKEGDFVRISLWDAGQRYLIYLPPATGSGTPSPGPGSPAPDPRSRP